MDISLVKLFFYISYFLFYIFSFIVSIWIGNFLTSFYYRIPRGITLDGKKMPPMCSTCGTRLYYPDYGPIYYYLFKAKSCKVCGAKVPVVYFFMELFIGAILILNFYFNDVNELSVISCFVIAALILNAMINFSHNQLYQLSLTMLLFCGIIRGVEISNHVEYLYDIAKSAGVGLIFSFLLGLRLNLNYRFFFMAAGTAIYYQHYAVLLAIAYFVHIAGLGFVFLLKNDKDSAADIVKIKQYTNVVTILCLTLVVYLVFFNHSFISFENAFKGRY